MFYDFLSYSRIGFKPPTETVVQPEVVPWVVLGKLDFGPRSGGPVAQALVKLDDPQAWKGSRAKASFHFATVSLTFLDKLDCPT